MSLNTFRCIIDTSLNIIERNLSEEQKKILEKDVKDIQSMLNKSKASKN